MKFERVLENGRLWAVMYDEDCVNILEKVFAQWNDSGRYIITGGAIKLTATMQEREHTLAELTKLNKVRDYLISLGIFDYNGFEDYYGGND